VSLIGVWAGPVEKPMHAKLLRYGVAPELPPDPPQWPPAEHPAWADPPVSVVDPSWPVVEDAIRRLDALRYRWLHLWPTTDERVIDVNPGTSEFVSVYGGTGAYVTRISFADGRDAELHFPERSQREVVVLPDPWGFADGAFTESEFRVCRDVELVVRAVRYYCRTGALHPSITWNVYQDHTDTVRQPGQAEPPSEDPPPGAGPGN
jgi:hypothetical protein